MPQKTPHLYNVEFIPKFKNAFLYQGDLQLCTPEEVTTVWKTVFDSFQRYADHIQRISPSWIRYAYSSYERYNPVFTVSFIDLAKAREFATSLLAYSDSKPTISYKEEVSYEYPGDDDE